MVIKCFICSTGNPFSSYIHDPCWEMECVEQLKQLTLDDFIQSKELKKNK